MGGIPREIMEHCLAIKPGHVPVKQKPQKLSTYWIEAIKAEVEKLTQASIIRQVWYSEWLANTVLVKKVNSKWHMCVDFTNLNKAYPKDDSPLPWIDQLADTMAGCKLLMSFMDAYSGYHQVHMAKEGDLKIIFATPMGTYFSSHMPFGLRNARATFQRLMNLILKGLVGRNIEVFVDDTFVKSCLALSHLGGLEEIFSNLRRFRVKLNLEKCTFGVRGGEDLGFLVSQWGIEANPKKIQAILNIEPPCSTKEVQLLARRMTALGMW
jgi:hypothetical protein